MKLALMQPYFFPYLGYFDLINYSEKWIVFDTVQYIRNGWINRNRILHPKAGWLYIIVPVTHRSTTSINEVTIVENKKWKRRLLGQLGHYQQAPYYRQVRSLVTECIDQDEEFISKLNVKVLKKVCSYLGIRFNYALFSELDLDLGPIEGPGDWALRLSEALGAIEYVNPPGGEHLFDKDKFIEAGIELTIRRIPAMEYSCDSYKFIADLSILDVLMWNSPKAITQYLNDQI